MYVSSFACAPETADAEFALSRREYRTLTGREYPNEVLAYHMRQSFALGELTPEEARWMGCEFADRFLKGNHAYIVSTHVGGQHIHNHIIWNAVSLDCTHKFRNFFRSSLAVRRLSNILIIKDLSRFSRRDSRGLVELEDLRDADMRIAAIGDSIEYRMFS